MENRVISRDSSQTQVCPICEMNESTDWRWPGLRECGNCKHVWRPYESSGGDAELAQLLYFDGGFAQQADFFTRFYDRLTARRRLREIKAILPTGSLLEVGAGRGELMSALASAGYDVHGTDLSEAVCRTIKDRRGLSVYHGTLETYARDFDDSAYDGIVICHVLEHVNLPLPMLQAARRVLKPGGIIYIAVPNASAWQAYLPGWTGYEPYHVHYFRSQSLSCLLTTAGFVVAHESTFEPLSGWFNTVTRSAVNRKPPLKSSSVPFQSKARSNTLLRSTYNLARIGMGSILSPLRWFQGALDYGEELITIGVVPNA